MSVLPKFYCGPDNEIHHIPSEEKKYAHKDAKYKLLMYLAIFFLFLHFFTSFALTSIENASGCHVS